MNILLYAFVDRNFGDNYFIDAICRQYPGHTFYLCAANSGSPYVRMFHHPNLRVLADADPAALSRMEGMILIGGDMLWDDGILPLTEPVRTIRDNGGWCVILGISLFHDYYPKTIRELKELFTLANAVVLRDRYSAAAAKSIAPRARIVCLADLAFQFDPAPVSGTQTVKGLLGISVRKKYPRNTPDAYAAYCGGIARTVQEYLSRDPENRVVFYGFSSGSFDDHRCAEEILTLCPEQLRDRVTCVDYRGDGDAFVRSLQQCEAMVCTRFHSLVFALLLGKPFVPIVYEEKLRHLLREIRYRGPQPTYEEPLCPQTILSALTQSCHSPKALEKLRRKASLFFCETDRYLLGTVPHLHALQLTLIRAEVWLMAVPKLLCRSLRFLKQKLLG